MKELEKMLKELNKTLEKFEKEFDLKSEEDLSEEEIKELKEQKIKGSLKLRKDILEHLKDNKPEALMYIDSEGKVALSGDGEDILVFLSAFVDKLQESGMPKDLIKIAVNSVLEG